MLLLVVVVLLLLILLRIPASAIVGEGGLLRSCYAAIPSATPGHIRRGKRRFERL